MEHLFARGLGLPPIATLLAAAGNDAAQKLRAVVRPDHNGAAVTHGDGAGLNACTGLNDGLLGVSFRTLALPIATDQHRATPGGARRVNQRAPVKHDQVAQNRGLPTALARAAARHIDQAIDPGDALIPTVDHHPTLAHADAARLHDAADIEYRIRKRPPCRSAQVHRAAIGLDAAQLLQAIAGFRRIGLEEDQAVAFDVDQHVVGCCHADAPAGGFDAAAVGDRGCDQRHGAAMGGDAALVDHGATGKVAVTGQVDAPGQEVAVGQAQAGRQQAAHVDARPGPEHHAIGVDQVDPAVGLHLPQDGAGVVADDSVEQGGGGRGLDDLHPLAGADGKALPVDDRLVAALVDQLRRRRLVLHAHLAGDHIAPSGQGPDGCAGQHHGGRQADAVQAEPP